jgi:hypothetical protein
LADYLQELQAGHQGQRLAAPHCAQKQGRLDRGGLRQLLHPIVPASVVPRPVRYEGHGGDLMVRTFTGDGYHVQVADPDPKDPHDRQLTNCINRLRREVQQSRRALRGNKGGEAK